MDQSTRTHLDNVNTDDREAQNAAFFYLTDVTATPVDWAYEVWDELVALLKHKDNHQRAIAAQLLCNLAKSDPQNRMLTDFAALLAVTKDAKFVTARHCLQSIWKVGVVGVPQQHLVVDGLEGRFRQHLFGAREGAEGGYGHAGGGCGCN